MRLAWVFARRELRSGVAGFRVFLACLALGVAALAAAGSTAEAFRQGLAAQARSILGGDIAVSIEGRRFTAAETDAFARLGQVSDTLRVRAMAQGPTDARRLAEVRGVDAAFPLAGAVQLAGAPNLAVATADAGGLPGAAVDPAQLDRLKVRIGQRLMLGDLAVTVRAALTGEPDRLSRGFALGPSVIISRTVLDRSGLIEADGLFGETARIALRPGAILGQAVAGLHRQFGDAGFRIRDRTDAVSGLKRLIDQLEFFLSFIGLAALLAGGLGVSSAVTSYLEARKPAIAVLKALGAEGGLIRDIYLIQIGALAALGVLIGLAVGAASPFILGWIARDRLPVPVLFALYPEPLIVAGLFGALAAAAFSLLPLARARATPPASLFRRDLGGRIGWGLETAGLGLAGLGLVALTLLTAPSIIVAGVMIGGVLAAFALLWLIGGAATRVAAHLRRLSRGSLRIGLANMAGPASAARNATPAIGLGVALLSAVVLIQSSLLSQVRDVAPAAAPSLILTQVPPERAAEFDKDLAAAMGRLTPDRYRLAPFATGRITAISGKPVDLKRIDPPERWAFDQDITISALANPPPDANLVAGRWWAADYVGSPLVMIDQKIARGAHLTVGDHLTIDLLGRPLEAQIAGLRQIDFGQFGATFPVILDPAALAGAGLRDIAVAKTSPRAEAMILKALGRDFPAVNVISVREQLDAAAHLFDQLAWAVRGAAGVAAVAGLLVLTGAITASAQTRGREAAILKVLGATRTQILTAYVVEYGSVGVIAGAAGVGLGAAAAYPVVVLVFRAHWSLDWSGVAALVVVTAALAAFGGLAGAAVALAQRPAPILRGE
jgi:putative ABC transport system permease protein